MGLEVNQYLFVVYTLYFSVLNVDRYFGQYLVMIRSRVCRC